MLHVSGCKSVTMYIYVVEIILLILHCAEW